MSSTSKLLTTTTTTRSLLALCLATLIGCGPSKHAATDVAPAAPSAPAAAASPEHAPPGAEPGSHEDWCGEHAVPESLCTRCNPKLIAAFKATGDWCAEHGLPESQCKLCHPDLVITRPPKKAP